MCSYESGLSDFPGTEVHVRPANGQRRGSCMGYATLFRFSFQRGTNATNFVSLIRAPLSA